MFTRIVLPLVAVLGMALAVFTVIQGRQSEAQTRPGIATKPASDSGVEHPPVRPGDYRVIAGAGIVEARRENIPIGTPVSGVVTEVLVDEGDTVTVGAPLFKIDVRELEAMLGVQQAKLEAARGELVRLREDPWELDVPPVEEAVKEAEARLEDSKIILDRAERLLRRDAGTASDYDSSRMKFTADNAALRKARAELSRVKVKAATWDDEIKIAEARVAEAEAQLRLTEIDIERRTICAPSDGVVLQVNVRPGQFAALIWNEPLVVLGDLGRLHVRVDIDEQDLPWFSPDAQARATLKGKPNAVQFELTPVRVEPYVIPKRSLTGDNSERVDTRVLQMIYELPEQLRLPLYVGQQVDVYINATEMQVTDS